MGQEARVLGCRSVSLLFKSRRRDSRATVIRVEAWIDLARLSVAIRGSNPNRLVAFCAVFDGQTWLANT